MFLKCLLRSNPKMFLKYLLRSNPNWSEYSRQIDATIRSGHCKCATSIKFDALTERDVSDLFSSLPIKSNQSVHALSYGCKVSRAILDRNRRKRLSESLFVIDPITLEFVFLPIPTELFSTTRSWTC